MTIFDMPSPQSQICQIRIPHMVYFPLGKNNITSKTQSNDPMVKKPIRKNVALVTTPLAAGSGLPEALPFAAPGVTNVLRKLRRNPQISLLVLLMHVICNIHVHVCTVIGINDCNRLVFPWMFTTMERLKGSHDDGCLSAWRPSHWRVATKWGPRKRNRKVGEHNSKFTMVYST